MWKKKRSKRRRSWAKSSRKDSRKKNEGTQQRKLIGTKGNSLTPSEPELIKNGYGNRGRERRPVTRGGREDGLFQWERDLAVWTLYKRSRKNSTGQNKKRKLGALPQNKKKKE